MMPRPPAFALLWAAIAILTAILVAFWLAAAWGAFTMEPVSCGPAVELDD